MTELLLEVQVVQILTVASSSLAGEVLLLQSPLEVEGSLAVWIDFCYDSHNLYRTPRSELEVFTNAAPGGFLYHCYGQPERLKPSTVEPIYIALGRFGMSNDTHL